MTTMVISVVITTKNRPIEFRTALESVLSQSYEHKQIVAVVDGSNDTVKNYAKVIEEFQEKVDFVFLGESKNGHGPSFSRNIGINHSCGQYVAFLDDDDIWDDKEHLTRFADIVRESGHNAPELYLTHQRAVYPDGKICNNSIWLEDLIEKLAFSPSGVSEVTVEKLLMSDGFSHMNCTLVLKSLALTINGFDEELRYEEDRDFYYRLLDETSSIIISNYYIGKHFIPINKKSVSNEKNYVERRVQQMQIAIKLLSTLKKKQIIKKIERSAAYTARHLANIQGKRNELNSARRFLLLSLALRFSFGTLKELARLFFIKKSYND